MTAKAMLCSAARVPVGVSSSREGGRLLHSCSSEELHLAGTFVAPVELVNAAPRMEMEQNSTSPSLTSPFAAFRQSTFTIPVASDSVTTGFLGGLGKIRASSAEPSFAAAQWQTAAKQMIPTCKSSPAMYWPFDPLARYSEKKSNIRLTCRSISSFAGQKSVDIGSTTSSHHGSGHVERDSRLHVHARLASDGLPDSSFSETMANSANVIRRSVSMQILTNNLNPLAFEPFKPGYVPVNPFAQVGLLQVTSPSKSKRLASTLQDIPLSPTKWSSQHITALKQWALPSPFDVSHEKVPLAGLSLTKAEQIASGAQVGLDGAPSAQALSLSEKQSGSIQSFITPATSFGSLYRLPSHGLSRGSSYASGLALAFCSCEVEYEVEYVVTSEQRVKGASSHLVQHMQLDQVRAFLASWYAQSAWTKLNERFIQEEDMCAERLAIWLIGSSAVCWIIGLHLFHGEKVDPQEWLDNFPYRCSVSNGDYFPGCAAL